MAEEDVAAQVRAMRSVRDFERLKAAGAFEEMTPEVVEALGDVIARSRRNNWRRYLSSMVCASALVYGVLTRLVPGMSHIGAGFAGPVVYSLCVTALSRFVLRRTLSTVHRPAVDMLLSSADPRATGALTEALCDNEDRGTAARVRSAMPRLLRRIGPNEANSLSLEHRSRLLRAMTAGAADYNLAVLEVFTRMGDWTCLSQAKNIAEDALVLRSGPAARARAAELVPRLEAIRDRQRTEGKLLRPADAPADATLLRPADGAPQGDEATLLRPADEPAAEVETHG